MTKKNTLLACILVLSLTIVGCKKTNNPSDVPAGDMPANSGAPMGKHAADNEETFIVNMIPHHQEAIDSSLVVIANTSNLKVKNLAQAVVDAQSKEITQMQGWLQSRYPHDALQSIYEPMMADLTHLSGTELDKAYLEGMIEHHQGAIQMANDVLMLAQRRPEVDQLATDIKTTQTAEITEMQKMLDSMK